MPAGNESVVRAAYAAYARGDVAGVLEFVGPDLEWIYLNPDGGESRAADLP